MRLPTITALAATLIVVASTWPADAQTRSRSRAAYEAYPGERAVRGNRPRTRITVRRQRSFLDPGTEVLPNSQPYLDYALPPTWYPSRIYDPTGSRRHPLPDNFDLPNWYIQ